MRPPRAIARGVRYSKEMSEEREQIGIADFSPRERVIAHLAWWVASHFPVAPDHADASVEDVLFIDDVARLLRCGRSTIERRRRTGTFPISELPSFDNRPRWSRQSVEDYLASSFEGIRLRRGRPRRSAR